MKVKANFTPPIGAELRSFNLGEITYSVNADKIDNGKYIRLVGWLQQEKHNKKDGADERNRLVYALHQTHLEMWGVTESIKIRDEYHQDLVEVIIPVMNWMNWLALTEFEVHYIGEYFNGAKSTIRLD